MADWSMLPYELYGEIAMRLEAIEDLVCFSAVCRLWNQVFSTVKHEFRVKTAPWLLLAENTVDNPDSLRSVFSPYTKRCYRFKLPEISRCRCWGSACGWVVTYNSDFELHMFNPLTKLRLPLPSRSSLPYRRIEKRDDDDSDEEGGDAYNSWYHKAFVLEVAPDDFVVFVTYFTTGHKSAYARLGDQSWTSIESPRPIIQFSDYNTVDDVVVHGAKILLLYRDAMVGYLDIYGLKNPKIFNVDDYSPGHKIVLSDQRNNLGLKVKEYVPKPPTMLHGRFPLFKINLVDLRGDLFMVVRRSDAVDNDDDTYDYETLGFSLYKLGFDTKRWSQAHNLSDGALFVGNNCSMSVVASRAGNCESNCIYFTDDASFEWNLPPRGGNDMGVFKLEDSQIDDLYAGPDRSSKRQPPLWFMPRF